MRQSLQATAQGWAQGVLSKGPELEQICSEGGVVLEEPGKGLKISQGFGRRARLVLISGTAL